MLSGGAFCSSIGTIGSNGITLMPLVFHWWNASHYAELEYFCWLQVEWGAFYSSIGTIGTIGTNGITFIPLVFSWWNTSHYEDLEYLCWLQVEWGCILLIHWYDWCQWNNIYSIGIPVVKCISLQGLRIFPLASGWVGVHSTRPLVGLVLME